ncbi:MAG: hypothetical protein R2712_00660 [Vicinamibacterales bacterium]
MSQVLTESITLSLTGIIGVALGSMFAMTIGSLTPVRRRWERDRWCSVS